MVVDLETLSEKLKSGKSTIVRTGAPVATGSQPVQPAPEDQRLAKYRVIEDLPSEGDSVVYRAEDTQLNRSVTINVLPESAVRRAERRQRLRAATFAVGGALAMAVVLLAVEWLRGPAPPGPQPLRRFAFTPESLHRGLPFGRVAISPDGKHIVYLGGGDEPKLWLRDIDREQPRELAGTENARPQGPFWSPDSQFIGFAAGNELKKVSVQGGPAITLCQLPSTIWWGGTWSVDGGSIVFSSQSGIPVLHEVPARGGEPRLLFERETSERRSSNVRPHFLPSESGVRSIVYNVGGYRDWEIVVKNLETGEREVLAEGAFPVYSPSGHILYQTAALSPGLWALPFSLETLKPTGEAFPIAENAGEPSVAQDGTLVYTDASSSASRQIVVRDRAGEILRTVGDPIDSAATPAISPSGRFVAVSAGSVEGDIWIYDLERDIGTRLTATEGTEFAPVWLSSGRELSYVATQILMTQVADGSVEARVLLDSEQNFTTLDWSLDDRYLAYEGDAGSGYEEGGIWYRELGADGSLSEAVPFLLTPADERDPQFSSDGRYLAYYSNESGRFEVYVRPFPPGPGKWQVSTGGGVHAIWSADGKEMFYIEGSTLMAVPISTEPSFTPGQPRRLFESDLLRGQALWRGYDVFPGGQRFVTFAPSEDGNTAPTTIRVVQNWFEEFKDRP